METRSPWAQPHRRPSWTRARPGQYPLLRRRTRRRPVERRTTQRSLRLRSPSSRPSSPTTSPVEPSRNWNGVTNLVIDGAVGSPSLPSARGAPANQAAWAFLNLGATYPSACISTGVNLASQSTGVDLLRLRMATDGPIVRLYVNLSGTLFDPLGLCRDSAFVGCEPGRRLAHGGAVRDGGHEHHLDPVSGRDRPSRAPWTIEHRHHTRSVASRSGTTRRRRGPRTSTTWCSTTRRADRLLDVDDGIRSRSFGRSWGAGSPRPEPTPVDLRP